ncbi:phosphopantetheine-binding protein [Streptomyces sp. ARC12]|uniref:phosphopantetheine-binding protein n=1 Tax=Streptomyces sp. ARC12 TaxID=2724151 RepID=UPI003857AE09
MNQSKPRSGSGMLLLIRPRVTSAITFLGEIGADAADVHADTDLFAAEVLDSLGTLAFLDFLEEQRGEEIELETLKIELFSTLRKAYGFVFAQA